MNKKIFSKAQSFLESRILKNQIIPIILSVPFPSDGNATRYLGKVLQAILSYYLDKIKQNYPKYLIVLALALLLVTNLTAYAAGCEGAAGDICTG